MSYLGTTKIGKMFLGTVEIAKAYLGTTLVFQSGGNLPYTQVAYIETDGDAYIDTGINGNDPRSVELKYMPVTTSMQCIIGVGNGNENTDLYYPVALNNSGKGMIGHRYFYASDFVVTVNVPIEAKCSMKRNSQVLQVKNTGDLNYTTLSKTQSSDLQTGKTMFLFAAHNPTDDGTFNECPSGSRLYYCKIYSTDSYTNLVFDGVPCLYNGEYGMWDRVSDSFFGNANSTGAFSGPSNS